MSLFNKVLASVGIGGSKVDTKLERDSLVPGELVKGVVEVTGGSTVQSIDAIYLSLNTTYLKESNDKKYSVSTAIDRFKVSDPFQIRPTETKQIPFSFRLPLDAPVTIGRTKVWLSTGLDIRNAVDPTDTDYVRVLPNKGMSAILTAVEDLGFRLREADCEQAPYRMRRRLPFVQEFEYVPVSGRFRGRLDELEIVMFPGEGGEIEVLIQVDRRARGLGGFLSEALSMDETNVRLLVMPSDLPTVREKMQAVIERYS
ncbi:sporulation protein SpoOM [Neobacillus piezotolerans]|uniref:Sporulation protein SpoOM n=1 Tax=Neobacillus piezotolerans TaxID=2259171 RepID=A0A3D8GPU2_9BACI|nr:sporulation protein [Neobacillus piezotolerans]RDU36448.1 sporulation protein SpoOM [Neobacillus piezotolerans]